MHERATFICKKCNERFPFCEAVSSKAGLVCKECAFTHKIGVIQIQENWTVHEDVRDGLLLDKGDPSRKSPVMQAFMRSIALSKLVEWQNLLRDSAQKKQ